MSDALEKYRILQGELMHIRWKHLGHDSEEEDAHLELMDEVWWQLTDQQKISISETPSTGALINPSIPEPIWIDIDPETSPGPVRTMAA